MNLSGEYINDFVIQGPTLIGEQEINGIAEDIISCINQPGLTPNAQIPGLANLIATQIKTLDANLQTNVLPFNYLIGIIKDSLTSAEPISAFLGNVANLSQSVTGLISELPNSAFQVVYCNLLEQLKDLFLLMPDEVAGVELIKASFTGPDSLFSKVEDIYQPTITAVGEYFEGKIGITGLVEKIQASSVVATDALSSLFETDIEKFIQVLTLFRPKNIEPISAVNIPGFTTGSVCILPIAKILELILLPIKIPFKLVIALVNKVKEVIIQLPKAVSLVTDILSDPIGFIKDELICITLDVIFPLIKVLNPIDGIDGQLEQLKNELSSIIDKLFEVDISGAKAKLEELIFTTIPELLPGVSLPASLIQAVFSMLICVVDNLFRCYLLDGGKLLSLAMSAIIPGGNESGGGNDNSGSGSDNGDDESNNSAKEKAEAKQQAEIQNVQLNNFEFKESNLFVAKTVELKTTNLALEADANYTLEFINFQQEKQILNNNADNQSFKQSIADQLNLDLTDESTGEAVSDLIDNVITALDKQQIADQSSFQIDDPPIFDPRFRDEKIITVKYYGLEIKTDTEFIVGLKPTGDNAKEDYEPLFKSPALEFKDIVKTLSVSQSPENAKEISKSETGSNKIITQTKNSVPVAFINSDGDEEIELKANNLDIVPADKISLDNDSKSLTIENLDTGNQIKGSELRTLSTTRPVTEVVPDSVTPAKLKLTNIQIETKEQLNNLKQNLDKFKSFQLKTENKKDYLEIK